MSEWKECKLGDLCSDISYGYTESASLDQIGPKFLRITDIVPGRVNWSSVPYCYISENNHDKYNLHEGDIVIARTGATTGYTYTIKQSDVEYDAVFASYLIRYRIDKQKAVPSFIGHLLTSAIWKGFVEGILGGSAQPGANAKQFADFEVLLPQLPEQKAIAGVLSSLDEKIDLLHRQNKTLEGMAEALWRKMFVADADPNWKKGKLEDMLTSIESGRRPKGGIDPDLQFGMPSIGAESINGIGNYEYSKTKYVTEEYYSKMNSGKIQNYDILIYKDGAYIGKKSMFANGFPFEKCCVNEHVFILRTGSVNIQIYLYFVLEQEELEQLNANSAQPGLNQEALKSFEIIIPNYDLINDFGIEVRPLIDKIFINSIQIRTLSSLRDTLLPKLMSGEVKVKL